MTLRSHLQCFSTPTLFITPALFPKIRSKITSEQSLLTVACVQTAHRYREIRPLLYIPAFAELKPSAGDWPAFRLLFSVSLFPFLSSFLSPCSCIVWQKNTELLSPPWLCYISFRCLLPAPLLLSFPLSRHSSTSVNGRFVFFDKKPKKKVSISAFLPLITISKSSQTFHMSYNYLDCLNNTINI